MPTYFKGAAIGSHWHGQDACQTGLFSTSPGAGTGGFAGSAINHVLNNSRNSPYLSLSRSYEVALGYALLTGRNGHIPTQSNPAFVYEIYLDDPLPPGLTLVDPVQLILSTSPLPGSYHHDGGPDFLLGVIDETNHKHILHRPRMTASGPDIVAPSLTRELKAIVRVLRDAEVLITGIIPRQNIMRWAVSP